MVIEDRPEVNRPTAIEHWHNIQTQAEISKLDSKNTENGLLEIFNFYNTSDIRVCTANSRLKFNISLSTLLIAITIRNTTEYTCLVKYT